MLKVVLAAFAVACFWGLSDVHECSVRLQMAAYPLGKRTASCNSPHDWMMSLAMDLAMDLAALCDLWSENGTNGCHLAGFSKDVAFSCHFVAIHPPPTLPPCRSDTGIGYASKKTI